MVHRVEERDRARRELPAHGRLSDPQQHREVRQDPEQQERDEPESMLASHRAGEDGDRQARDDRQVAHPEPAALRQLNGR
jgi:hypothetical protein